MKLTYYSTQSTNLGPRIIYYSDDGRYKVNKFVGYTKDHSHRHVAWLIISPLGETPLHDWRDMQEIKNILCGPESFAVEIYPPESELVDACNNFHLWVYLDDYQLPIGFKKTRVVVDPALNVNNIKLSQRPFRKTPDGAIDSLLAVQIMEAATPSLMSEQEYQLLVSKEKRRK